jgi:ElaB/YqjD/DUF883 family membrane-anchored ribosome-binding protein
MPLAAAAAPVVEKATLLKSAAEDAFEEGVHAARRALKSARRRVGEIGDLKDEALHQVKRQPLRAVGIAAGAGLILGLAAGLIGARLISRQNVVD